MQKNTSFDIVILTHNHGGICHVKNNIADLLEGYEIMDALSNFEFYHSGAVSTPVPSTHEIMTFLNAKIPNLWTYYSGFVKEHYSHCFVASASWCTRSLGMQLYKYNIIGFLHWGDNYYNNRASGDAINPYVDLSGEDWVPAGDTFMIYPDSNGTALESLRLIIMEEALGDEITFTRCAYSADEMLRVREAVNDLIKKAVGQP